MKVWPIAPLLLLVAIRPARGAGERDVLAYPEGVRFELETGNMIDGADGARVEGKASVELRAARDEVVAFQALIRGRGAPGTAHVAVRAHGGVESTVYFEQNIRVAEPSASEKIYSLGPASYPDVLIPTATVAIPAAPGAAVLWVDLFVSKDAKPGVWESALEVEGAAPIPIRVEVLPLELPERDVARLGAVNFGSFLVMEKIDRALMKRWMQLAHAHHLNVELMRPVPKISDGGEIDWDSWAARFAPYLDGTAFTREQGYVGPREGKPVTKFVAPHAEWWPSKKAADGFLPADAVLWSKKLAEWEHFARARGWLDAKDAPEWIIFINSLDEPKTAEKLEAIAAYGPLIKAAELEDRRHVVFRVDGVLGARIDGWPDERKVEVLGDAVVDLWNLHGAWDTAPLHLLRDKRAIFYASSSGGEPAIPPLVVDSAIAGARAWAWIVARYRLEGALNWEVDYVAGCVENPRCSEGGALNLDALLIYRGHEVGRGSFEPIPSMRLKALRRGAQDVALLELLAAKDPERARLLAEKMVPRALGDRTARRGKGAWPRGAIAYDRMREEIIDRLLSPPDAPPDVRPLPWVFGALAIAVIVLALTFIIVRRARR